MDFQSCLREVQHNLKMIKAKCSAFKSLASFSARARDSRQAMLQASLERLRQASLELGGPLAPAIQKKIGELISAPVEEKYAILEGLAKLAAGLEKPAGLPTKVLISKLPPTIRSEILADLSEVERCFKAGCYRSAIILCGRILETALHYKYYAATGQDLLEKAPGTGLGSLIAKLSEKGVQLPPGLPNQIHLVNQVRIFSVHTKQDAFMPSETQARAIVLFTIDVLNKLYGNDEA